MRVLRTCLYAASLVCGAAAVSSAQSVRVGAPTLRIGRDEQPGAFITAVAGAVRLPNKQIVVGNRGGEHALLVFDEKGKFVRALARKGKGPGEVGYLLWVLRCGNDLFTGDIDGERVQVFTGDLKYTRAFRFASQTYRLACNDRAQFVHMGWESPRDMRDGVYRAPTAFWISPADSTPGVSLGMLPGSERFGIVNDGKPVGNGPRAIGREPALAIGATAAYVALGDSLSVRAFDFTGKPLRALSAPHTPVAATAADVDAAIERSVTELGESTRQRTTTEFLRMPMPRTLPATRDLLVDATGLVWVQAFPSARKTTVTWTLFRPAGGVAARIELPAALKVYEVGRDYLLGGITDDDTGIIEVRLYPVTR